MKVTKVSRLETASMDDVNALLEGKVFHATSFCNYAKIKADGYIRPNKAGTFNSPFGQRTNGYFQKRGCVSVFDYRVKPPADSLDYRGRCPPLQLAEPGRGGAAMLIVDADVYARLIPWNAWSVEDAWKDMLVPHVEAGHRGPIALARVSEVILVSLLEDAAARDTGHSPAAKSRS